MGGQNRPNPALQSGSQDNSEKLDLIIQEPVDNINILSIFSFATSETRFPKTLPV